MITSPDAIDAAVRRLATELRAQYHLAFEPLAVDGEAHAIRVDVRRAGLRCAAALTDALPVVLARLKATNFYVEDALIETLFKRWLSR